MCEKKCRNADRWIPSKYPSTVIPEESYREAAISWYRNVPDWFVFILDAKLLIRWLIVLQYYFCILLLCCYVVMLLCLFLFSVVLHMSTWSSGFQNKIKQKNFYHLPSTYDWERRCGEVFTRQNQLKNIVTFFVMPFGWCDHER